MTTITSVLKTESPSDLDIRLFFATLNMEDSKMAITRRQRQVYDFIADFLQRNGYSPSFEEIGAGMGLSSLATVHKHVSNLETKGLLHRDYNRSRSIDIIAPEGPAKPAMPGAALAAASLPLVGRIAAGRPVEQFETPETISLADFTGSKDVFVLEVSGDSMQDEHILNGDYVLVEKTETARNGEIVVALVGSTETTLKRFYNEGEMIRLQPSNATMQPIMVAAAEVQIQGRVIGVLRKY